MKILIFLLTMYMFRYGCCVVEEEAIACEDKVVMQNAFHNACIASHTIEGIDVGCCRRAKKSIFDIVESWKDRSSPNLTKQFLPP